MNKSKKDIVADVGFLIALGVVIICLIFNISFSGKSTAEAAHEPAAAVTVEETEEPTQEPTETEPPATEATQPPVTLYDVPLDADLQLHIIETAEAHGIDPAIIMAMAFQESTYNPGCIGDGGNSYGLLQVQPRWHSGRMEKLGCTDLLDPFQNVTVAVDYLVENLNRYGSIEAALTAYNAGSYTGTVTGYARSVLAKAEELRGETYVLFR